MVLDPAIPTWPPYSLSERATILFDFECRVVMVPIGT